jgi:fermentation-respiration switch protein FrsA (DUF1100 family)
MVANTSRRKQRLKKTLLFVGLFLSIIGCSPQRYFFYPNRTLYADPDRMGLSTQSVQFPSLNGKQLYALLIPTSEKPKGTIVHFHGNFGNVSNHFPLALFLTHQGFDVLSLDYQGYGVSEGHPTIKNVVEDGIAAVRYAQAHLRDPKTGVCVFGQSLGGAVGIVVTAQEPEVKGAVIEAAFSGYRAMGREVAGRHILTWPLMILTPFISRTYDPGPFISQIAPRPLLLIHGDADTVVPVKMSRLLFDAAREPKELWIVPGAEHLGVKHTAGSVYETKVAEFFEKAITGAY